MSRVRISTTVDRARLEACRRLVGLPDAQLVDRALSALIEVVEAQKEIAALEASPYEEDADLAWEAPPGPDLPYDGDIPDSVVRLAESRRSPR